MIEALVVSDEAVVIMPADTLRVKLTIVDLTDGLVDAFSGVTNIPKVDGVMVIVSRSVLEMVSSASYVLDV